MVKLINSKPTPALERYVKNNKERQGLLQDLKEESTCLDLPNFMRLEKTSKLGGCKQKGEAYMQEMMGDSYTDCQKLIYKLTHDMASKFHMPFEELLGQAHLAFMRAAYRYSDDASAKFTTWISFCITRNLTDWCKNQYTAYNKMDELEDSLFGAEDHNSFLLDFKDELEEDGEHVVNLIFNTPEGLQEELSVSMVRKPRAYLAAIKRYLKNEGWSSRRIASAFEQVQQKLLGDNK